MAVLQDYTTQVIWMGNRGQGTKTYGGYARSWDLCSPGKPVINCSNDPVLGGDPALFNSKDLFFPTLSAYQMLWYLYLASEAGLCVQAYQDRPIAQSETLINGVSRFVEATIRPQITLSNGHDPSRADLLHQRVSELCFYRPLC